MNILKLLSIPLIPSHIILFSLLTTITFSSVDPKFEACKPQTCGNGRNISYPFYIIGKQEPFCGYPRFGLTCAPNGFPILNASRTQYIVRDINYDTQSLRVSIPEFSNPTATNQCLAPIHNFTTRRFSVAPKQKEVLIFYGCDLTEEMKEHKIGCSAENRTSSVVGLYREDQNLSLVRKNCKGGVVSTRVEDEKRGNIEEALERGFVLNWRVSNCGECSSSGGRCGVDSDPHGYAFRCFCPDRVHSAKCDEPG